MARSILHHSLTKKDSFSLLLFLANVSIQTHHPPTDMLSDVSQEGETILLPIAQRETILHTPSRNVGSPQAYFSCDVVLTIW